MVERGGGVAGLGFRDNIYRFLDFVEGPLTFKGFTRSNY